jgi:antitoxin (DNA-binding transcriptional repressor) of toxin-antitoxin stability system
MNTNVLTVEDAARCLPDLVDRVHASGESALLLKSGKPVAQIVSVTDRATDGGDLIAFLRKWRAEHPEPDEQFGDAIDESRKSVRPPHDPWE